MARVGLTIDRLVEAGAKLADECGFEAVTPTALAKLFGIKVASLYSHVTGIDDLRNRIALLALDRLADEVTTALAGRAGKDAIVALANAHRDFAKKHPGLFVASRHPLNEKLVTGSGGVRIAELTRLALRGYALDQVAETHAIRLLGSVLLGFPTLELAGGFSYSQPSAETSWQATLESLHTILWLHQNDVDKA